MKYCIHCGKEIKETAGFCPHCGKQQAKKAAERKEDRAVESTSAHAENPSADKETPSADVETLSADAGKESERAGNRKNILSGEKRVDIGRYLKVAVPIAIVCIIVIAVIAIAQNRGGSHASDEKALKKIIADQKAMGATINAKNGASYEWNEEGRLVGINWSYCSLNGSISFSKLDALEKLYIGDNQLSSLDVSGCKKLKELYCGDNQLSKLDVSACKKLKSLYCSENSLGALDVEKCVSLKDLECAGNKLEELDVSNCTKLKSLYCDEDVKISGCSVGIIRYR